MGINSTPAIDRASNTLYVVAYTLQNSAPVYQIHAIDITTLQDTANTVISASHTLKSGKAYVFDPMYQRQRAALLVENGNVYAAFASFCDFAVDKSRGWILGWNEGSLKPLPNNNLLDQQESGDFYLASIWMSGRGLASYKGDIVAITGNSNPNGMAYDAAGGTNYSESIIRVASDLSGTKDWFTPSNFASLESIDYDFGSGGISILPGMFTNAGTSAGLAVAAGKDGQMYLVNMDSLGHGGPTPASPMPVGTANIGYCWCAESAYIGPHGPTIVSSGGGNGQLGNGRTAGVQPTTPETLQLWAVPRTITGGVNALANVGISEDLAGTPQHGGFFTSESSSNSTNVVIWALTRPDAATDATGGHPMYLFAFSEAVAGGKLTRLFKGLAGQWGTDSMGGNSNIVPVVANGRVFVATNKQLAIFGT